MTIRTDVVLREQLLGVGGGLGGLRAVVLDDQLDLLAVDAAGRIDAIDVDAQRVDRRRIGAEAGGPVSAAVMPTT